MHVVLIVIGLLLLVYGGGCVLLIGGFAVTDPQGVINDLPDTLPIVGVFGILPLAMGWFLFRHGLKIDRDKRQAVANAFRNSQKDQT